MDVVVENNNVMADEAGSLIKVTGIEPESGAAYLHDSLRREELKTLVGLNAPIMHSGCYGETLDYSSILW